jgi:hypothetical protein
MVVSYCPIMFVRSVVEFWIAIDASEIEKPAEAGC